MPPIGPLTSYSPYRRRREAIVRVQIPESGVSGSTRCPAEICTHLVY